MTDYQGMLFRIEDVNGYNPVQRSYDQSDYSFIPIDKDEFDKTIATMIREEINGAKNRTLHSYSKSIATCILKYNEFTDNELHILIDNCAYYNTVSYIGCKGVIERLTKR